MKTPPTHRIIGVLSNYVNRYLAVVLVYRVMSKFDHIVHQSSHCISKHRTNPYAIVIVLG